MRAGERLRSQFELSALACLSCLQMISVRKAGFNQQIAQYRGKVPDQHLTDLAVGHFEDQLAKSQEQV